MPRAPHGAGGMAQPLAEVRQGPPFTSGWFLPTANAAPKELFDLLETKKGEFQQVSESLPSPSGRTPLPIPWEEALGERCSGPAAERTLAGALGLEGAGDSPTAPCRASPRAISISISKGL